MKCKYCKSPDLPDHAVFCPWCGKRQRKDAREISVPAPRKLPSGTFYGRLTVAGERVSVSAPTEEEYFAKARAIKAGLVKTKSALPKITLGAAIDKYLKDTKNLHSPSTVNNWKSYRKTRFTAYMDMDVSAIPWQKMVNDEADKVSGKTVQNAFDLVRHALDYSKVPRPSVKLPKSKKAERQWLDYQQIETFCAAVRGKPYELGALLALHGLRRSELLHLTAEDIDLKKGIIRVRGASVVGDGNKLVDKDDNKTEESTRMVHIVITRLAELLEGREGRLITTNPTTLYGSIRKLCEKNGLPPCGVHSLRHSFCSLAHHLHWDELTVQREGGWKDSKIVHEIYTHLAAQDANDDIQRMKEYYELVTKNPTDEKIQ